MNEEDEAELIRRRLEDEIKANVEKELFRYYRNVGSVIITVLGFVGVSIGWPSLVAMIKTETKNQIALQVSKPVAEAENIAKEAQKVANDVFGRLEVKQTLISESIGRIGPKFDQITERVGSVDEKIKEVEKATTVMRERTTFLREQVQADPVTKSDIAKLKENIGSLEEDLNSIAIQTANLAKILISAQTQPVSDQRIETAQKALTDIADKQTTIINAVEQESQSPQSTSIVYVQFAGGTRRTIEAVDKRLQAKGWRVPGEERVKLAAGKREIRYYYNDDKKAAEELEGDLRKALTDENLNSAPFALRLIDPDNFKIRPAKGILEIWIEF